MYHQHNTGKLAVAYYGDLPDDVTLDRESRQQRIRAVLMTFCDPKLKYDGITAWEIAGKVLAVLDEEASDSVVRR